MRYGTTDCPVFDPMPDINPLDAENDVGSSEEYGFTPQHTRQEQAGKHVHISPTLGPVCHQKSVM